MVKIAIAGGGWAGCAAAVSARKKGADVVVLERTDMLLGAGLVGGIMRNNGRFTATEEMIAMGGGDMFEICDKVSRHHNIEFPGHKHASLYDIAEIEPAVKNHLIDMGIEIQLETTAASVEIEGDKMTKIKTKEGMTIEADAFIDTTGTAGPQKNCNKYGNGCAMCVYRCPSYGGRVSITGKAGIQEMIGEKPDGTVGAMSGSCKIFKESLSKDIREQLDKKGVVVAPIPEALRKGEDDLSKKACQQYALKEYAENVILLDTGHAKLMSPFFPLEALRMIPGFEKARYEDPYAGGLGNSMRYMALAPRDDKLKVEGVDNLFCGGEKAGLLVGHTEAIVTGTLAGYNAAMYAKGEELLEIPRSTMCGESIAHVNTQMQTVEGRGKKYTFSGAVLFDHLEKGDYYTTDIKKIQERVDTAGMTDVFSR